VELTELPGDASDEQARYIEAFTGGVRVASIYLPNGNPVDTEKYPYKLGFMERLHARAAELLEGEDAFVLGGDYNAIPEPGDVYDAEAWEGDALYRPETRAAWRKIVYLGLTDAFRALNTGIGLYSYWDYQRGAWQKDNGIRIDHLMLSPQAADLLTASGIDRTPRLSKIPQQLRHAESPHKQCRILRHIGFETGGAAACATRQVNPGQIARLGAFKAHLRRFYIEARPLQPGALFQSDRHQVVEGDNSLGGDEGKRQKKKQKYGHHRGNELLRIIPDLTHSRLQTAL